MSGEWWSTNRAPGGLVPPELCRNCIDARALPRHTTGMNVLRLSLSLTLLPLLLAGCASAGRRPAAYTPGQSLAFLGLHDAQGQAVGWQQGNVLGVYAHGLFECPAVMQALFGATVPTMQDAFDTVADLVQQHLDAPLLAQCLGR